MGQGNAPPPPPPSLKGTMPENAGHHRRVALPKSDVAVSTLQIFTVLGMTEYEGCRRQ